VDRICKPTILVLLLKLIVLEFAVKVEILGVKNCCCSNSRWCDWCSARGGGIVVRLSQICGETRAVGSFSQNDCER
jgi:hypothetical protein